MDGSLVTEKMINTISHYNMDRVSCSMGAGFYTITPTGPAKFKAQVQDWPSSIRAELAAIEYALLAALYNCKVVIYTDSQAAIDGITRYNKASIRKKGQLKNWIYINRIIALCKEKNIEVAYVKIKGHSNIEGNDIVDELAKQELISEYNNFDNTEIVNSVFEFFPSYNYLPIDMNLRKFMMGIMGTYNDIEWSLLNLNNDAYHLNDTDIDWDITWLVLHQCKGLTTCEPLFLNYYIGAYH